MRPHRIRRRASYQPFYPRLQRGAIKIWNTRDRTLLGYWSEALTQVCGPVNIPFIPPVHHRAELTDNIPNRDSQTITFVNGIVLFRFLCCIQDFAMPFVFRRRLSMLRFRSIRPLACPQ